MRKKGSLKKRSHSADYVYSRVDVGRFINYLMMEGKKSVAEKVFYDALKAIEKTAKEDPVKVFEKNGIVEKLSQTPIINGITWYYDTTSGAAAGTKIENRIYHTLDNQTCYEVDLNLATSSLVNTPSGSVKPVNESEIWNLLENILETLIFIK